jgi:hypothetical protein
MPGKFRYLSITLDFFWTRLGVAVLFRRFLSMLPPVVDSSFFPGAITCD